MVQQWPMEKTMKIIIPVAAPVSYNPAYFIEKSFKKLGIDAKVMSQGEFNQVEPDDADLFFGVDSGGPLFVPEKFLSKFAMWFIDSRRNHNPALRNPDDDTFALRIIEHGGLVFQAQKRDVRRVWDRLGSDSPNVKWLPLAADPDVWSDQPQEIKKFPAVFVGNCYDPVRHETLGALFQKGLVYWPGIEGAIMEEGATQYRKAHAGLNIPSFYGTPECYDINMRVFEILSCGVVLITNYLPELIDLGIEDGKNCICYNKIQDIETIIKEVKNNFTWQNVGRAGRQLILEQHTYDHRAKRIIECTGLM